MAGLERYDVITKIDRKDVRGAVNVGSVVRGKKPGDSVEIEYYRAGRNAQPRPPSAARPPVPIDPVRPGDTPGGVGSDAGW